jgi:hypothetical protein
VAAIMRQCQVTKQQLAVLSANLHKEAHRRDIGYRATTPSAQARQQHGRGEEHKLKNKMAAKCCKQRTTLVEFLTDKSTCFADAMQSLTATEAIEVVTKTKVGVWEKAIRIDSAFDASAEKTHALSRNPSR